MVGYMIEWFMDSEAPFGYDFLIKNVTKPMIYVAGFISRHPAYAFKLRKEITRKCNEHGILTHDPLFVGIYELEGFPKDLNTVKYNWKYRDEVIKNTGSTNIVERDLRAIRSCDGFLMYYDKSIPIIGTAMELFYVNHILNKPTALWNISNHPITSIWLKEHLDFISTDLEVCVNWLKNELKSA